LRAAVAAVQQQVPERLAGGGQRDAAAGPQYAASATPGIILGIRLGVITLGLVLRLVALFDVLGQHQVRRLDPQQHVLQGLGRKLQQ